MTRIEIKSRVGPDGVLNLRVPIGSADANREVVVTVESASAADSPSTDDWQAFVDETYGSCAGLGLEAPVDPPPQVREW